MFSSELRRGLTHLVLEGLLDGGIRHVDVRQDYAVVPWDMRIDDAETCRSVPDLLAGTATTISTGLRWVGPSAIYPWGVRWFETDATVSSGPYVGQRIWEPWIVRHGLDEAGRTPGKLETMVAEALLQALPEMLESLELEKDYTRIAGVLRLSAPSAKAWLLKAKNDYLVELQEVKKADRIRGGMGLGVFLIECFQHLGDFDGVLFGMANVRYRSGKTSSSLLIDPDYISRSYAQEAREAIAKVPDRMAGKSGQGFNPKPPQKRLEEHTKNWGRHQSEAGSKTVRYAGF